MKKMADFLDKANKKMKKEYGASVLYTGDDAGVFKPFPTGFPTIDHINSGIGGFPRGGIVLIHGLPSTGKSSFVLESIRNAMEEDENLTGLYIDVENALTEPFLKFKKIPTDRLTITPLNTEDALTIAKNAIQEDIFDIVVIDSLAKLDSKDMVGGDIGEKKKRNQRATIITEFLRFITFTLRKSNTALVLVNQEIENQERMTKYDPKTILPCGQQQKFSANLILQLKRSKKIKSGDKVVGYMCSVTATKNKIAPHERSKTMLSYIYNRGFVREISILDYLEQIGIVKKSMGYYSFVDTKYYDGKFRVNDADEILQSIKDNFNLDLTKITPDDIEYEIDEEIDEMEA